MARIVSFELSDDLYKRVITQKQRVGSVITLSKFLRSLLLDSLEVLEHEVITSSSEVITSSSEVITDADTVITKKPQSDSVITSVITQDKSVITTGSTVDPLPIVDFPQEKAPVITKRYQNHPIRIPVITEEKPTHCDKHPDIELTEEDGNLLCYKCLNG